MQGAKFNCVDKRTVARMQTETTTCITAHQVIANTVNNLANAISFDAEQLNQHDVKFANCVPCAGTMLHTRKMNAASSLRWLRIDDQLQVGGDAQQPEGWNRPIRALSASKQPALRQWSCRQQEASKLAKQYEVVMGSCGRDAKNQSASVTLL